MGEIPGKFRLKEVPFGFQKAADRSERDAQGFVQSIREPDG
jgi:hypothetical protein